MDCRAGCKRFVAAHPDCSFVSIARHCTDSLSDTEHRLGDGSTCRNSLTRSSFADLQQSLASILIKALPYIRKAKILGFEVELTEEIKNLSVDVEGAKEAISTKRALRLITGYEDTRTEVLNVVKSDPRAALMILAARIEQAVMLQLAKHRLRQQGTEVPMRSAMELGVQHGVFPAEVLKPFREFWDIRNRVAHGRAFDVEDSLILSLVSIGLEVLKLVSLEENDGPSSSE